MSRARFMMGRGAGSRGVRHLRGRDGAKVVPSGKFKPCHGHLGATVLPTQV
jgi:hypothetical protein